MSETVEPESDSTPSGDAQNRAYDFWPQDPGPGPQQPAVPPPAKNGSATGPRDRKKIRIGLWGSPRSGKTTYLAALRIAAHEPVSGYDWVVSGRNPASQDFIIDKVNELVDKLAFPIPTVGVNELEWNFQGNRERRAGNWLARLFDRLTASGAGESDIEFIVHLQDAAGETYGETASRAQVESLMHHLMHADGIVYLFDPIGNAEEELTSFKFFFATLERLAAQLRAEGRLERGRLPHDISVCVTKFDDPAIFQAAMEAHVVYQVEPGSIPNVPPEIAGDFLDSICEDDRSRFVLQSLRKSFLPERIQYFATSSIGFRVDPRRGFDFASCANVDENGKLLSAPTPINTLEPIISLAERIRRRLEAQ